MADAALDIAVHAVALLLAVRGGEWLTGRVLQTLRLVNDDFDRRGTYGAGRIIGRAERFLAYVAVASGAAQLLAALVAVKTIVRYPEVRVAAERAWPPDAPPGDNAPPGAPPPSDGRFAEYYLVGTLVSLSAGVACPIAARLLLAWLGGDGGR